MLDVVPSVKANEWIAQCCQGPVRVEILAVHAAIAGGVHEQGPRGGSLCVVEMQAKRMVIEVDEFVGDDRARVSTALSQDSPQQERDDLSEARRGWFVRLRVGATARQAEAARHQAGPMVARRPSAGCLDESRPGSSALPQLPATRALTFANSTGHSSALWYAMYRGTHSGSNFCL